MIVKQADSVLTLLELFASEQRPMTLTQLSQELGLPKSSTHNLIKTLTGRGYLYEVRQRGGVYPSRKLSILSDAIAQGDPITALVSEFLKKISAETGETAILASRSRDNVTYICVEESKQAVRYSARVGDQRPIYATSGGKAILSTYQDEILEKEIGKLTFVDVKERTIKSASDLWRNIVEGRERGYFQNLSEYTSDVAGIGIPIIIEGRSLGLSLSGPDYRVVGRQEELAACLHNAAKEILACFDNLVLESSKRLSAR